MDTFDIGDGALIRAGIGEFRWRLLPYDAARAHGTSSSQQTALMVVRENASQLHVNRYSTRLYDTTYVS